MTTKEFLIKVNYESQLNQAARDVKGMQAALSALGVQGAESARLLDQTVSVSVDKLGKTIRTVSSIAEIDGKKIKVAFQDVGDSIKNVSGSFQTAGTIAGSLSGEFTKLASRALLVTPIWEAMRFALQSLERTFTESIQFMIEWETELAKMRVVTGATKAQIDSLGSSLLNVSEKFGISNKDVAETANQWLRMGASLSNVVPLLETTSKLSLISGQSMTDSAKAVNSVMSSFGLSASEASSSIDKLISTESKSGVSLETLYTAFEKAGIKAKQSGVSFDELTGYIVAINQKSRQSGELIGTQLTSELTRLGTTASEAAQKITGIPFYLDAMGKQTTTQTFQLRNMNDIIRDLAKSWGTLTIAQQDALAKALGGNLRTSSVIALLENFNAAIKTSKEVAGATSDSEKEIGILTDTTSSKVTQLQSAWAKFISTIGDTSIFKGALDSMKQEISELTQVIKLAQNPWEFLFTKHEVYNPREKTSAAQNQWEGSTGKLREDQALIANEGEKKYTAQLLTEAQVKLGIQKIEESSVITREDKLATVNKELSLLAQSADQTSEAYLSELHTLTTKKEKLEVERQLSELQEKQNVLIEQMKAGGASQLQIDIEQLAYLKAIRASREEINKQQAKVDISGIEQYKNLQEQIVTAILGEQKAQGENQVQILQNRINLEDQLGIHRQGVDLLKEQLDLYNAIHAQASKTTEEKIKEINALAGQSRQQQNRGNAFNETFRLSQAEFRARQAGVTTEQINTITNPGGNRPGGINTLQEDLKRALADPLDTNITRLSVSIDTLAESIVNSQKFGTTFGGGVGRVPTYTAPNETPLTTGQQGAARFTGYGAAYGGRPNINLSGITIAISAEEKSAMAHKSAEEVAKILAPHIMPYVSGEIKKPGSRLSDTVGWKFDQM